jgi:hypothetical protein
MIGGRKRWKEMVAKRAPQPCPPLMGASFGVLLEDGTSIGQVTIGADGSYVTDQGERGKLLPFEPGNTEDYTWQEPPSNQHPPHSLPNSWGIVYCLSGTWCWAETWPPTKRSGTLNPII